jgi:hypothetical protein
MHQNAWHGRLGCDPATPPGPRSRPQLHAAAEATLDPCSCGGHFRYDAQARCPSCGPPASCGIATPMPRACSMTDSRIAFKRLSAAEALRARYIDFEGEKNKLPVLLSVPRRAGRGLHRSCTRTWSTWRSRAWACRPCRRRAGSRLRGPGRPGSGRRRGSTERPRERPRRGRRLVASVPRGRQPKSNRSLRGPAGGAPSCGPRSRTAG